MRRRQTDDRARRLLAWYDIHRRELPWRAKPGEVADPYRVWLSEIMLQQTTVQAVAAYYRKFIARWPNVKALAKAPLDDVLAAWAGLGYYARARNLHKAAKLVAGELGGKFPMTMEELRKLPGIGAYTAGAIAAIAFDAPEAAMDANAERVIARLFAVEEPLPGAKVKLLALGKSLVPQKRAGDFAQALMDLGSGICTVKRPACENCPWTDECEARRRGIAEALPMKGAKAARPLKRGAAFVARDAKGAVLLVKRPEKGLLGSMMQPPQSAWGEKFPSAEVALEQAPFHAAWKKLPGIVRHGFTHFELEIEVWRADVAFHPPLEGGSKSAKQISGRGNAPLAHPPPKNPRTKDADSSAFPSTRLRSGFGGLARQSGEALAEPDSRGEAKWIAIDDLKDAALPTVMRKIIAHAIDDGGPLFRHAKSARKR